MESSKTFSTKQFLKGALIGGIVGGSAALLLAPKSGKETQDDLQHSIDEWIELGNTIKEQAQTALSQLDTLQELAETLLPEFEEGIEKSLNEFEFKSTPRIEAIKQQVATLEKNFS